ncbi:MFS transporter [Gorillibacterium sp. sgz5001074]|uniref:MFS transporter n=1 Tax=Gorillibacterium sp. sgz5001074 TaxID=3446695 RepID=UPI003F661530
MEGSSVQALGLRMSRRAWVNFRWDFLAAVTFSLFNVVFNQFYMPIAIRNGASDLQVGLLSAAPAIGLLFSPLWAGMAEQGRAKNYVVVPNVIGRLLIIIPALFTSPWVFVGIALLFHMLMGIQAPAYATLMTQIYPADIRGRLMGYVRVAMGLLMIPMAYGVGRWIDVSGSGLPLMAASITGTISICLFYRLQDERKPNAGLPGRKRPTLPEQLRAAKENRPLLLFLAATTLSGFGNMLANPLYNIIQVDHLELSNSSIGFVRVAYFSMLLVAYLLMGWVIDRYSPKWVMMVCMLCHTTAPLLYGLFGTYPAVLTASGLQGLADASWDLGCMAYVFKLAPGREGLVFGLHLMLFGIRGSIGPLLGTGLNGVVPISHILIAASLCAIAGFVILMMTRERPTALPAEGFSA